MRRFFFVLSNSSASSANAGATMISKNVFTISSALFLSISVFTAKMPPYIDFGSALYAFIYAS